MKRLHVHIAVEDLAASIKFYNALFGQDPTVSKPDYAKWQLDDPRVNFAISDRSRKPGLDHLGIQVEDQDELRSVYQRLQSAGGPVLEEGATTCCYARSEKSWTFDPQGLAWEAFMSVGESPVYGEELDLNQAAASACCTPAAPDSDACCTPKADSGCCG